MKRFCKILSLFLVSLIIVTSIVCINVSAATRAVISFNKKDTKENSKVTIDNNTILAGEIFDQKEDEYYVLVYTPTEMV